ncbi:hypothetical protein [Chitinilyticum piscinae]|uniref:Plasmid segregation centromere-binding protein ParG n=1 Tax=Chitinilyticum piscinae TaxID=2866724 RepID=A0A8J7G3V1_9NEIS|nr:hypothetical protein [Chitinilyticum piscinae]MBE9610943.1 hypothetical protein [Chitinilyticum piscinae]
MSMKGKPNTAQFRQARDPTAFLEGGEADKAEKPGPVAVLASPPVPEELPRYGRARVQKIFNFPEELADRLRREALRRSEEKGGRVTEKDIVIEALEKFLAD